MWGGAILLFAFLGKGEGAGAPGAGQMVGLAFGFLMFGAGLYYLVIGIRGLADEEPEPKPRKRKRRRKRVEVDDE